MMREKGLEDQSHKHCFCCSFFGNKCHAGSSSGLCCRQFVIDCMISDDTNCWLSLLLSAFVHVNKCANYSKKKKEILKCVKLCMIAMLCGLTNTHGNILVVQKMCFNHLYTTYCEKTECCTLSSQFIYIKLKLMCYTQRCF